MRPDARVRILTAAVLLSLVGLTSCGGPDLRELERQNRNEVPADGGRAALKHQWPETEAEARRVARAVATDLGRGTIVRPVRDVELCGGAHAEALATTAAVEVTGLGEVDLKGLEATGLRLGFQPKIEDSPNPKVPDGLVFARGREVLVTLGNVRDGVDIRAVGPCQRVSEELANTPDLASRLAD